MSKGALGELLRASVDEFIKLAMDVPKSEKIHVTRDFEKRVALLEDQ